MITIRPLTREHIETLTDPVTEPGIQAMIEDSKVYWDSIISSQTAFAGMSNGKLVGCAGYLMRWKGVAEVWFWDTDLIHSFPISAHKVIKRSLDYLESEKGVHRISCEVRTDNLRAQRWVRLLGFRSEGLMRKRGPDGSDFFLYARVKGN